MRFIMLTVLLCSACLVYGQESAAPGPLNRLLNWIKNPYRKVIDGEIGSRSDKLNGNDFAGATSRNPLDQTVNNIISDRILEESRPQQVNSGSPFISENFEDPLPSERQLVTSDRDAKNLQDSGSEDIPIAAALRIVQTSNLTDCVGRVICELSCNGNAYGARGRTVLKNMLKLQFDPKLAKESGTKFFRQFATKGRLIARAKQDCSEECSAAYPSCQSNSTDLVAVASMFQL